MVDLATLKSEIVNDPKTLGYAPLLASGSHNAIRALLNNKSFTLQAPVTVGKGRIWAAQNGILSKLRTGIAAKTAISDVCEVTLDLISNSASGDTIDLADASISAMFQALLGAGVITGADATALTALAAVPASRAEVLFGHGTEITDEQVGQAMLA